MRRSPTRQPGISADPYPVSIARQLIAKQLMRGADQFAWRYGKAVRNPVDHPARSERLRCPDRNRWLNFNDHHIV